MDIVLLNQDETIVKNIQNEINARIDNFSQDVIVSNLELLLSYCNRFYSRQFLTRKMATNDLLSNFENLLEHYFSENSNLTLPKVLPSAGNFVLSIVIFAGFDFTKISFKYSFITLPAGSNS